MHDQRADVRLVIGPADASEPVGFIRRIACINETNAKVM
jgi:hypothetical protein